MSAGDISLLNHFLRLLLMLQTFPTNSFHFLSTTFFWCNQRSIYQKLFFCTIRPLTKQWPPVVSKIDSVRVHHWNDLELENDTLSPGQVPQPIHQTSPPWISASPSALVQSCAWRRGSRWAPAQRTKRVVIIFWLVKNTQTPARHTRPDSRQGAGEPSPSPPSSSPARSKRKRWWAPNFGILVHLPRLRVDLGLSQLWLCDGQQIQVPPLLNLKHQLVAPQTLVGSLTMVFPTTSLVTMSGRVSTSCWMKACTLHGRERESRTIWCLVSTWSVSVARRVCTWSMSMGRREQTGTSPRPGRRQRQMTRHSCCWREIYQSYQMENDTT